MSVPTLFRATAPLASIRAYEGDYVMVYKDRLTVIREHELHELTDTDRARLAQVRAKEVRS